MARRSDPETVTHLIPSHARVGNDVPAVYFEGRAISFAQLEDESRRAAAGLAGLGVAPGDRVALWLPNVPAWIALYMACARLGAVVISVNTRFRTAELDDILGRVRARILVYWPGFREIDFSAILRNARPTGRPDHIVAYGPHGGRGEIGYDDLIDAKPFADDYAMSGSDSIVFSTSGTTRAAKLVVHTQASIVRHARLVATDFGCDADDAVMLQVLPLCGVFGFCQAMASLAAGRPMVMLSAFDAGEAVARIAAHRITHMNGTDDMYRAMLEAAEGGHPFRSLRLAGFASFNMDASALDEMSRSHDLPLVGLFGMSEVQALFARQHVDDPDFRRIQPGGRPVAPDARARVRDPRSGALLPPGETGALELQGPSQMRAYLGDAEATAAAFTDDGFVRTGDLARLRGDGGFTFVARMGDALRLGGFLVSPAEIEAELSLLPGIDTCQVVGAEANGRNCAVAFVILLPGAEFNEAALRAACAKRLAGFKVPERIVVLEEFPAVDSPNGRKIQRGKLRERANRILAAS